MAIDTAAELDRFPIIDVDALRGGDQAALGQVASALGAACREVGFFYVTGHGISDELVTAVFDNARRFFASEDSIKDSVSFFRSPHNRGYIGMGTEQLDPSKPADLKEAFNIGLDLTADDPRVLANEPFRGVNQWPEGLPGFRTTMLAYYDAALNLGRQLHKAFALDLGLMPNFFDDKLDAPLAVLRVLHYPPRPANIQAGQLGAGIHTDYGNVTILATDGIGGLEVQNRAGAWLAAPHIPGAFICNIGDCLMRWTNDEYVSTPHRVTNPADRERYSIAFFLDPNPEAVVACLDTCMAPARPPRYAPILSADYLRSRLDPTYEAAKVS